MPPFAASDNGFVQEQLRACGAIHVVVEGESLSMIARDELSDWQLWQAIYRLNKETIGPDPNLIHPGQSLLLPRIGEATECTTREAPPELLVSEDVAGMSVEDLDLRITDLIELLDDCISLPADQARELEQQLSDLQREKLGRAAFAESTTESVPLDDAPARMSLPEELVDSMDQAWKDSLPPGGVIERGGILVRGADESLEWKSGTVSDSSSFTANFEDVEPDEELLVLGHTHPYDEGYVDVAFSGEDLANLVYPSVPMQIVRSGDSVFVVTRTAEFEQAVTLLDDVGRDELWSEMVSVYDDRIASARGSFEERVEDAVVAVCEEFSLAFYRGAGNDVARVSP